MGDKSPTEVKDVAEMRETDETLVGVVVVTSDVAEVVRVSKSTGCVVDVT
jgi:hypothetical protein